MSLIVVGSANIDLVVRTPRFPVPGETIMGTSFHTFPGGKGANQTVAAARLGGDVRLAARLGADAWSEPLRRSLRASGVGDSLLQTDEQEATGVAVITVDDKGQNTIVVAPGANSRLDPHPALAAITSEDVMLLQLEIPLSAVSLLLEKAAASIKVLNPAPACEIPDHLYPFIQVITPNETEARLLTGVPVTDPRTAQEAARILLDRGVGHVVITLGAMGCVSAKPGESRHIPAFPVEVIDTVAAGDAFSGALALFLSRGTEMDEALRLAGIAAALSTTKQGAQDSMPTWSEVEQAATSL